MFRGLGISLARRVSQDRNGPIIFPEPSAGTGPGPGPRERLGSCAGHRQGDPSGQEGWEPFIILKTNSAQIKRTRNPFSSSILRRRQERPLLETQGEAIPSLHPLNGAPGSWRAGFKEAQAPLPLHPYSLHQPLCQLESLCFLFISLSACWEWNPGFYRQDMCSLSHRTISGPRKPSI